MFDFNFSVISSLMFLNQVYLNLGGLFKSTHVLRWGEGGGGRNYLCLKLVRIMLETPNFVRKYFFGKNSTFTQSNSVRAVLEIFSSVFNFCKMKGYY